jgi:hypothetical protein
MQRGWLLLSHLSMKTYNISRALTAYDKYLSVLRKVNIILSQHNKDEKIIASGEKILEGIKFVADEIKKKQNLYKNKEDSKKILDELCKKYINRMFWEDLEKPFSKLFYDAQGENPYLNFFKQGGMVKPQQ